MFFHCIPTQTLALNISQFLCWYKECSSNLFCYFVLFDLSFESEILLIAMIHTKALYLKCAEYITCSNIKDLNLDQNFFVFLWSFLEQALQNSAVYLLNSEGIFTLFFQKGSWSFLQSVHISYKNVSRNVTVSRLMV